MYNGCWYNCLSFSADLHVEAVGRFRASSQNVPIPITFSSASTMPSIIGSPVAIAKGTRL